MCSSDLVDEGHAREALIKNVTGVHCAPAIKHHRKAMANTMMTLKENQFVSRIILQGNTFQLVRQANDSVQVQSITFEEKNPNIKKKFTKVMISSQKYRGSGLKSMSPVFNA